MSISEDDRPHPKVGAVVGETPTAFISYSWYGTEHKDWVFRLAERLQAQGGVRVILSLESWSLFETERTSWRRVLGPAISFS